MTYSFLKDLRVIESSAFIAAPLAGLALAQFGAQVIRVEMIGGGIDYARMPRMPRDDGGQGRSFYWPALNKGKRSIAIDRRRPEGRELIHLRTVHYGDDRPFQAEDRWINPAAAPGAETVDFQRITANEWLVRNFPWLHADMAFSAENASARDARLLETRQGTALLILQRTTFNDLGAITSVRVAFHPGYAMIATH